MRGWQVAALHRRADARRRAPSADRADPDEQEGAITGAPPAAKLMVSGQGPRWQDSAPLPSCVPRSRHPPPGSMHAEAGGASSVQIYFGDDVTCCTKKKS